MLEVTQDNEELRVYRVSEFKEVQIKAVYEKDLCTGFGNSIRLLNNKN